jgi:hypothetical protein
MVCQCYRKEIPFKFADGVYYFEPVNLSVATGS